MVGRIVCAADFQRVLSVVPKSRSAHFAAHHLPARPTRPGQRLKMPKAPELSTGSPLSCPPLVDDLADGATEGGLSRVLDARSSVLLTASELVLGQCWLGLVVPKRHAKRSATRNLIKRQMRAVVAEWSGRLAPGLWVLRLKSGFDVKQFPSAASDALRHRVRAELVQLMQRALGGLGASALPAASTMASQAVLAVPARP